MSSISKYLKRNPAFLLDDEEKTKPQPSSPEAETEAQPSELPPQPPADDEDIGTEQPLEPELAPQQVREETTQQPPHAEEELAISEAGYTTKKLVDDLLYSDLREMPEEEFEDEDAFILESFESESDIEHLFYVSLFDLHLKIDQPRGLIPISYYEELPLNTPPAMLSLLKQKKDAGDKVAESIYREIEALARNIERYGLIHPINVVRVSERHYTILHGERRAMAFALLFTEGGKDREKYGQIPALVRDGTEDENADMLLQLSENLARSDLPAIRMAWLCQAFYTEALNELRGQTPYLSEKLLSASAIERGHQLLVESTGAKISQRTFGEYLRIVRNLNNALFDTLAAVNAPWETIIKLSRFPQDEQARALKTYLETGALPKLPPKQRAKPAWSLAVSRVSKWIDRAVEMSDEEEQEFVRTLQSLKQKIDNLLKERSAV
ncbi:MAG: ParB N-terminal domain-containing protein [Candidatus Methanomethylicaceae archaeon]